MKGPNVVVVQLAGASVVVLHGANERFPTLVTLENALYKTFSGMASMLSFIVLELGLRKCNATGPRTGSTTFAVGNIFMVK
ncbi:MAG TPA: hypothetical protein VEL11_19290 [Candidatus Bathyarchaeia archaeon]|nr:hypothetical protein [Candidatus Bathyarchaeia archaeon]